MKRREFVLAGITAAGAVTCALAPVRGSPAFPPTPIPAGKRPLFAVIYDRRFEAAQAFANAAAWRGHKVLGYDGDLTAVWLREIEPRWSRRAGALAGMSTPTALFCLEQLAAQHWLRVVTRNEQRMGAGELLIILGHRLIRPHAEHTPHESTAERQCRRLCEGARRIRAGDRPRMGVHER